MTDDDRRDPDAVWDMVEDLLAGDELAKRAAMPAEHRHAEMRAQGLDPARARVLADKVLAAKGLRTSAALAPAAQAPATPAKVVSLAAEREKRRRPAWVLTLAAAAALVVLAAGGGGIYVALREPTPVPTSPVPTISTAPPGPSPEQLAAQENRAKAVQLRKDATDACRQSRWDDCADDLRQAALFDPEGDRARGVLRLDLKASRGRAQEEAESKGVPSGPRTLRADAKPDVVAALSKASGQALLLRCAGGWEPSHVCGQLAEALASAGWKVTRAKLDADGGVPQGMLIEVATDADDATQAAADVLADGMVKSLLWVRGPDDMAPGADAPLRLTVGTK